MQRRRFLIAASAALRQSVSLPCSRVVATVALVAAAMSSGCTIAGDGRTGTAITNVTVIDAVNGVRDAQTVVFTGDKIAYVGPEDAAPAAAHTIDATGKYLIPGLWDMHVHLSFDDRFSDVMAESFLRYGVTGVRDTGGLLDKLLPVVRRMRDPATMAPRVFFGGPLLDGSLVVYDGQSAPHIGIRNATPAEAARNVATLKAAGVSFIKIYEMVSPDVFDALVTAADEHGLPIAAHVPLAMTASDVGPKVDSMEHLRNVELDCAANWQALLATRIDALANGTEGSGRALRAALHAQQRPAAVAALDEARCDYVLSRLRNTIQVVTAGLNTIPVYPMFDRDDWPDALALMPEEIREEWRNPPSWLPENRADWDLRLANFTLDMIGRLKDAGVPIGAGTDTPIGHAIPGYSLLNELEILVEAGLTPLEAIEAATVQPAVFLSLEHEFGAVDVGRRADLVLLDANPLDDIRHLRQIDTVIAQGRIVPR